jgi:hypothetical protein
MSGKPLKNSAIIVPAVSRPVTLLSPAWRTTFSAKISLTSSGRPLFQTASNNLRTGSKRASRLLIFGPPSSVVEPAAIEPGHTVLLRLDDDARSQHLRLAQRLGVERNTRPLHRGSVLGAEDVALVDRGRDIGPIDENLYSFAATGGEQGSQTSAPHFKQVRDMVSEPMPRRIMSDQRGRHRRGGRPRHITPALWPAMRVRAPIWPTTTLSRNTSFIQFRPPLLKRTCDGGPEARPRSVRISSDRPGAGPTALGATSNGSSRGPRSSGSRPNSRDGGRARILGGLGSAGLPVQTGWSVQTA